MAMDRGRLKKKYAPAIAGRVLTLAGVLLAACIATAKAAERCTPAFGRVVSVQGNVEIQTAGAGWQAAALNATLCAGDMVRVHQRSRAALLLSNETTLRLDQGTTLMLVAPGDKNTTMLEQISGGLHVITRTPKAFKVKTPFVNANVEGTEFAVRVTPNDASIAVYEGQVVADNDVGSIALASGEEAVGTKSAAPTKKIAVRTGDAVAWTLYVPTLFDYQLEAGTAGGSPAQVAQQRSIALYRSGQLIDALAALDNVADSAADARFLTYRAGLLLVVGRLDEAKPEIDKALRVDPNNSDGHALLAIIAVAENDRDSALEHARRAVSLEPRSPAALIALSYAQQARFEIEAARGSVQEAVKLDPRSALVHARLAELEMSTGNLERALAAGQESVRLKPTLGRTQTVLGFANLVRIDTLAAKASFERAIELDAGDPLPRLGLGLAKIREGDMAGGRQEMDIAAILDPRNSLIRSYLGKAYFEEKRNGLAGEQFGRAKKLDELDPTPHFYDALLKYAENQPVEALRALETSIRLNDNRAVYRSRLLLDDDRAARQVGQARIYNELGFQEVALLDGFRALALNPGDYSAHRFLADVYADTPRHEIARVSELLQAQLWQPLSIAPIQPQLADDHSFILRGAGPSNTGLNEFDRLFVRNQITGQVNALFGGSGTKGDQVIVSGIRDKVSVSIGQFYYESKGFRENNALQRRTVNMFAQAEFTPSTSVQVEFRDVKKVNGDLALTFDPDAFTLFREHASRRVTRLGGRHMMSTNSGFIANVTHEQFSGDTDFNGAPVIQRTSRSDLVDFQFVKQWPTASITLGANHFGAREENKILGSASTDRPTAAAVYAYAVARPSEDRVSLTLGLARERLNAFFDSGAPKTQLSPKIGAVWEVSDDTTIRLAAFKNLKRRLIANESIEPSHVAGFNQLFDDFNGTKTRRVAFALDHKARPDIYSGIELSGRRLLVPQGSSQESFDWREHEVNAYANLIVNSRLAATARYRYERLRRPPDFATGFTSVDTRNIPITLTWRSSAATVLHATGTLVRQSGQFFDANGELFSGKDGFFVADVGVTLRLPNRYGSLSIEARNLFDKRFRFEETNAASATISRRRLVFARATLTF